MESTKNAALHKNKKIYDQGIMKNPLDYFYMCSMKYPLSMLFPCLITSPQAISKEDRIM